MRELRASVREWLADVDEMVLEIGNDHWLDIGVEDLKRIGESADADAITIILRAWGGMAATRMEIAALPECDDGAREAT